MSITKIDYNLTRGSNLSVSVSQWSSLTLDLRFCAGVTIFFFFDVTAFAGMAVAGVPSCLSIYHSMRLEEGWGQGSEEWVPAQRMQGLPPSINESFSGMLILSSLEA